MFDYYTLGTQTRSAADDIDQEPHLSPRQRPRELSVSTPTNASSTVSPGPCDKTQTILQPIDNLVDELSRQSLFPKAMRQPRVQMMPAGSLPSSTITDLSAFPLDVDDDCDMDLAMDKDKEYQPVADWKRARRQWYSGFANNPNNARAIQARLKDMISGRSQCNVLPARPFPSSSTAFTRYPNLPKIEADDCDSLETHSRLEVDEGFCEGDTSLSLEPGDWVADEDRMLGAAGTLRSLGVLKFKGSAQTALRCQKLVRHRPRMRKRKGPGPTHEPRSTY